MKAILTIVAAAALCCPALAQTRFYVDGDCGDDAWSGTNFRCQAPDGPKKTIAAAVEAAAPGDEVQVAGRIYRGPGNRDIDLGGKAIRIYGSGTIDCEGLGRAFVLRSGETRDTIIEGFTIINGAAPGGADLRGGGIAILSPSFGSPAPSPTIRYCTFENCDTGIYNGGAMLIQEQSQALIEHCIFRNNRSGGGGAVQCEGSRAEFIACEFIGNEAGVGGAMLLTGAAPLIVNCLYVDNAGASPGGGAIFGNSGSTPTIVNSTFTRNSGPGGAWYSNRGSVATIANTIMWGNTPDQIFVDPFSGAEPVVTYSDIEGGWPGAGNIDIDPRFVDPASGVFEPESGSPCNDAGDSTAVPEGIDYDLAGQSRIANDAQAPQTGLPVGATHIVDMGAYERQSFCADCDGNGVLDFFDFLCFQTAFAAQDPYGDCDASGTFNFFDFLCFQDEFAGGCSP